jgi:hypothetical protein
MILSQISAVKKLRDALNILKFSIKEAARLDKLVPSAAANRQAKMRR